MRRWDGVFFDLDGTLADTVELTLRCFRHTMRTHDIDSVTDEDWLANLGRPLREQMMLFVGDADEAELLARTYTDYQSTIHDDLVRPYPGATETIEGLRAIGTTVALVTSKRRKMTLRTLACCGLEDAFEVLVCGDDVSRGKPDPEPVRLALASTGLDDRPDAVLFVGDAPYDVIAGREAGTATAVVEWSFFPRTVLEESGPDYWLPSLGSILSLER